MTIFDDAVARAHQYDSAMYLGRLVWYSISEQSHIDHHTFCQMLLSHGIQTLPGAPRPSDVFKRACTASQRVRVPTGQDGEYLNFMVRDVGKDGDNIYRRLVEERVDSAGHRLAHTQLFEIHFRRSSGTITSRAVVPNPSPEAEQIVANIESLYYSLTNMLTPYTVRELSRKILQSVNAIVVRPSGGVYFVREDHADTVAALETIINQLPGSSFHSLPLVDDTKQRAMLKQAFEDESIGEIDSLLGEMGEILRSSAKITSDRYADFKVKHDFLMAKVRDYSNLLDEAMEQTASRLEVMQSVMFDLLGRVRV